MTNPITPARPTLRLRPGTATRVIDMLDDTRTSAADIGAVVAAEPAITTRLLALANSPVFRRRNDVRDINQAIAIVGQSALRGVVMGVAMDTLFEEDSDLDPSLWDHAMLVASASVAVAQQTGADAGQAYCAGLMHDIGQIVMAVSFPAMWSRVLGETNANSAERLALEQELFEVHHADLGSQLLADLGLPEQLVVAIRTHHEPISDIDSPLGLCVAVAEIMADLAQDEPDAGTQLEHLLPDLDLDAESLLTGMAEHWAHLQAILIR